MQFDIFCAPIRKVNTSFIITFFKPLTNLTSARKEVEYVSKNLLNGSTCKTKIFLLSLTMLLHVYLNSWIPPAHHQILLESYHIDSKLPLFHVPERFEPTIR